MVCIRGVVWQCECVMWCCVRGMLWYNTGRCDVCGVMSYGVVCHVV